MSRYPFEGLGQDRRDLQGTQGRSYHAFRSMGIRPGQQVRPSLLRRPSAIKKVDVSQVYGISAALPDTETAGTRNSGSDSESWSNVSKVVVKLQNPLEVEVGDALLISLAALITAEHEWTTGTAAAYQLDADIRATFITQTLNGETITWTNIVTTPVVTFGENITVLNVLTGYYDKADSNKNIIQNINTVSQLDAFYDPSIGVTETIHGLLVEFRPDSTLAGADLSGGNNRIRVSATGSKLFRMR